MRCAFVACLVALLAACSGSDADAVSAPASTMIQLEPQEDGWSAEPVVQALGTVSHNSMGYTGEIDHYEVVAPETGRLQIALSWDHESDFDLIVASDAEGKVRLAEGVLGDSEPEYVGTPVVAGQVVHILVAGYAGTPGDYRLEIVLLSSGIQPFELIAGPDLSRPLPRNLPIVFTFNQDLDPGQSVGGHVLLVSPGHLAQGAWCVQGPDLVFYPKLPTRPNAVDAGLFDGFEYTLQIPRGTRGVRSIHGEYLDLLQVATVRFDGFVDEAPGAPPRVTDISISTAQPWDGSPISISVLGALDPDSISAQILRTVGTSEVPLPTTAFLEQEYTCLGTLVTRIAVSATAPLPPRSRLRVVIPGTVRGISGSLAPDNLLTTSTLGDGLSLLIHSR